MKPVAQSFLNLPEATQLLSYLFIKKKPWIDDEQANYDIYSYWKGPSVQPIPNFLQVCFSVSWAFVSVLMNIPQPMWLKVVPSPSHLCVLQQ